MFRYTRNDEANKEAILPPTGVHAKFSEGFISGVFNITNLKLKYNIFIDWKIM
jgi:hypothetical protein